MNIINVIEYDDMTNDYNNNNCTTNEKNFDRFILALLLTLPGGLSFLCLMSSMVFTLIKPLISVNDG